jgi:hypothetical protein
MKHDILPSNIVELIRDEGRDLDFGVVQLKIFLRGGKPRYEYSKSVSILDDQIHKDIDGNFIESKGECNGK